LKHLLAISGSSRFDAALGEEPKVIVVADGVVDLEAECLLRMRVEIEETISPLTVDSQRIKNMIPTLNGKICVQSCRSGK
jgi:hypothetical protein